MENLERSPNQLEPSLSKHSEAMISHLLILLDMKLSMKWEREEPK